MAQVHGTYTAIDAVKHSGIDLHIVTTYCASTEKSCGGVAMSLSAWMDKS